MCCSILCPRTLSRKLLSQGCSELRELAKGGKHVRGIPSAAGHCARTRAGIQMRIYKEGTMVCRCAAESFREARTSQPLPTC